MDNTINVRQSEKYGHGPGPDQSDVPPNPLSQLQSSVPCPHSLFTQHERWGIVLMIALAGWFSTLSSFIYYPAIPVIAEDLDSSISMIDLTVTSYLAVSAIAPAIVGDAADTFGRRPLYAITLMLYVAANLGIALQHSAVALLLLRMLQSAGISGLYTRRESRSLVFSFHAPLYCYLGADDIRWSQGTFSVAYGVIADISTPMERGAFVSALSFGITTAPSLGPVLGGAFAAGPGWRWIFWFLVMASGLCLVIMALALPETHHSIVGNGGTKPPRLYRPLLPGLMRPWEHDRGPEAPITPASGRKCPNPIKSLRILARKDVAVSIMPGSFLYTVYCCIHASLATTLVHVYHVKKWQAGLAYLPFGVGAITSTIVSSKWIDHDYRVVAEAHGLPINKASGDDLLHFPIEKARMRSVFPVTFASFASVLAYGWLMHATVVSHLNRFPILISGFFSQYSPNEW
ncbi:related to antibiotic resistance protein [Fusarium fujikuroi]|uniref:Related to antibiotic resistance protein n=1 Tax=Gibberella fujikuroi (strain CBS 195.34 / IMI 58289 / NRRL A-6831) TaxID=1279085 RepID=S0EH73_GIBF5|nr:related to antibiotic resistance protein [Fusarium fujikuroi IMI 58289]KLP05911.1 antibiotic resistance protein [Fusarium fujikuroi]KLP23139.1 antibiotic resistance protein [Fusarium fujikuroi]QGI68675.1 hypothetical protein CEK27_012646 [Fusarium fujikuroi]QGI85866.1 hypothetical protein CEK25_012595 [Fusarium fujikuroi]QGI86051.1 hypothetical protein CEK25_012780 [Fusarium fujikuroi]